MTARDTPNPKRCTQQTKLADGTVVECSDVGGWTLDKARQTWRPSVGTDKSRRCWAHGPGSVTKPAGKGGRSKTQPNAKVQHAAGRLLDLAADVTKALIAVQDELSMLGFPGASSTGVREARDDDGPVSRDALRIVELTSWREDLRDWLDNLGPTVDVGAHIVRKIRNVQHARGVKLCAEHQQGRQGSIEWGDPTCTELPTKAGLCSKDYQAERRWREAHGLTTDQEPAA